MSGGLKQGQYIRLERIAEDLGVSPSPVREGLLALRGEGFVQLEPRRGFVVSPLSRQDVHDLFLIQATLAGELAARAAVAITQEQVVNIVALQEILESAALTGDLETIEEANYQFHRAINRAADSPKLGWMLSKVVRYAPRRFYATIHGWQQASVHDHRSVIAALRDGSAETAREAMRSHILHASELLVAHLAGTHFWDDQQAPRPPEANPDRDARSVPVGPGSDLFRLRPPPA